MCAIKVTLFDADVSHFQERPSNPVPIIKSLLHRQSFLEEATCLRKISLCGSNLPLLNQQVGDPLLIAQLLTQGQTALKQNTRLDQLVVLNVEDR